jgi:drug/metabolite transporter superfamily protein YnfA
MVHLDNAQRSGRIWRAIGGIIVTTAFNYALRLDGYRASESHEAKAVVAAVRSNKFVMRAEEGNSQLVGAQGRQQRCYINALR